MRCARCSGLVIPERIYATEAVYEGWKCIVCGEAFDEVVLHNRLNHFGSPMTEKRPARRGRSMGG